MSTVYPSAKSPAFALAMASVGPAPEWAWLDYLSPGDAARVALLRQIQRESDTPDDVREAARTAYNILREIAGWRMAEAPRPLKLGDDRPCHPLPSVVDMGDPAAKEAAK